MVSLLAVLGRHRTLLDSIYTPNHNTSTMQDALLDRGLVLYLGGGGGVGLHAQDSNGEPWRQGPHIPKSRLKAADNLGEEEV